MAGSAKERWLFLTGKLAFQALHRVLDSIEDLPFEWQVREVGVSVAALMTAQMLGRRLTDLDGFDRVVVPGRCRGDLEALAKQLGLPVQRGPEELKDLPRFFGRGAAPVDLTEYKIRIFAEIVDAPELSVAQIVERAQTLRNDGADVIDLGCLPDTSFDHLADAVTALKDQGFVVSVDSMEEAELMIGARAGADYLLSLTEHSIDRFTDMPITPVLVPAEAGDMESLMRAIKKARALEIDFLADPILDPIHFGLTESIVRYRDLRQREPEIEILMGTGNVTELTHADTAGITMTLMGIMSELNINAMLTTQVSQHARKAIREADLARRILLAATRHGELPKNIDDGLMMLHERDPFPDSADEIRALAAMVRDPNYRIQIAGDGVYLFNRDGVNQATDAFDFWPHLDEKVDASHAFYLGAELMRAQIAWELGKRYSQDQPLNWGVATDQPDTDLTKASTPGTTRRKSS